MRIDEWEQLSTMIASCVEAVVASAGFRTKYLGTVQKRDRCWAETVSIIGLTGTLRGTLILSMPNALLARTHPTGGTTFEATEDWSSELANLLLGRLKSRLMTHGVTIELSTPVSVSATAFRFARFAGVPVVHEFEAADIPFQVIFESIATPDALFATEDPSAVVAPGELVTF